MSEPKRFKRSKFFVNAKIQGRMLARFASYWVLYHVVLFHAMFLYRYLEYRQVLVGGGEPVRFGELYRSFAGDNVSLIACAVALTPIIFWDMVKLTHRIAGPLVRFERALRSLAEGETVPRISLRRGDLPVDLRDALNNYLETLARRANCFGRTSSKGEPGETDENCVLNELEEIHAMLAGHADAGTGRPGKEGEPSSREGHPESAGC